MAEHGHWTTWVGASVYAFLYRHSANFVSIVGVLPIGVLVLDGGRDFLIPLMVYNNIMDDLDGLVAAKLEVRSQFGARLDNVCDAIAHTAFVLVVGIAAGAVCAAASLAAVSAIIVRSVSRLDPGTVGAKGSPTNELIRHMLFVMVLTTLAGVPVAPFLAVTFALHTVSMLVPFRMPLLIRSMAKSPIAIGLVNVALIVAWLVPHATPLIAASFIATYLYSFAKGAVKSIQNGTASA